MGRVSRYKKIKAFDPFSKTHGHVDLFKGKHYDMAPSAKDMEAYSRVKRQLPSAHHKPETDNKVKPGRMFGHVKALPGESMKTFNKRVNAELKKRVAEVKLANPISTAKKVSEGRKEFLDRKSAKKSKAEAVGVTRDRFEADEHIPHRDDEQVAGVKRSRTTFEGVRAREFATDSIKFGERADRPPTISVLPRKSKAQRTAEALAQARRLSSSESHLSDVPVKEKVVDAKEVERKAALQRAQMEKMRIETMAAYATLKKRRGVNSDPHARL